MIYVLNVRRGGTIEDILMTNDPFEREQRIADIRNTLALPGLPAGMRQGLEKELAALQTLLPPTSGKVEVGGDARINGVVVGVNLGRIVYGRDPQEDERRRLVWYLSGLAAKLAYLPLRGLEERLDQGKGIELAQVYVMLATESYIDILLQEDDYHFVGEEPSDRIRHYFVDKNPENELEKAFDPRFALPTDAIINKLVIPIDGHGSAPDVRSIHLYRSVLATESVYKNQQFVLLGDPGSGKSTFVRHLAWALAQRGLDQLSDATALFGWNDQQRLLPILLPLRTLAGRLARDGVSDETVTAALREVMEGYGVKQVHDLLTESLRRGKALLLFDGLDEVPLESTEGVASRRTTLEAVHDFMRLNPKARSVLTCRTRAFDEELRALLAWPIETIAPFTLGQVRHFVPAWYGELRTKGQITTDQHERLSESLIAAIVANPKLREMAQTPLLLTMMALVLYTKGELPRDRPQLYERILELLLGQWDKVRDGHTLAEAIGLPDWGSERIRPLLDQLSFDAHRDVSSEDGRGRIARGKLRDDLCSFFEAARVEQPWEVARRCLDYFEQRSGLLAADESQSYVFAHLTLQEHCAGRHLLRSKDAVRLVMQQRDDDRWREPILLGLGVVQEINPALIDRVLSDLIDRDEAGRPKPVERWYRDLIFAAEIGVDRDWNYLRTQQVNVERLQRDLRRGFVTLLNDKNQPLPVAERVRAGFLLGDLGDPRFPISIEDWKREIERVQTGETGGYFCRIEARDYVIGSSDDDQDASENEKPQHTITINEPLLIARFPITNAQWLAWTQSGGKRPFFMHDDDLNKTNQPIVGMDWNEANQFCEWLSERLGATVRLPSEYEWEAAARGGDARRYPWCEEWQDDRAACEEDQEIRGSRYTVPVGCYPAGAAPCGALDMAGNVLEWTSDRYCSYPGAEKPFANDERVVLRGGAYYEDRTNVRCGARDVNHPADVIGICGFRVLVAPRLAHLS